MIIATAGHIDHGKTLLVKTLTGVDTDRLPEEKARGISIDLGFAYLPLANGGLIGFVDVPGHERFVRNMLAGVSGIDYALLIVAADDGVMPQTLEHLHILNLLGVARGAAVITKSDRVDADRSAAVAENISALLSSTRLAGAPVFIVSAVTGTGMPELKAHLVEQAAKLGARSAAGQYFRYAVDRVFTVAGSGTVVTGTVFNGEVKPGEQVTVSPSGKTARVRGIQIHGKGAERASSGQRCALNLTGIELADVARGDWILATPLHKPTSKIDAEVTVLADGQPLKHWTPVHLHLGTADVTARVSIRRGAVLAAGETAIVRLLLDKPIGALHGDRFILRDQSAAHTLGGGRIIDPFPVGIRRHSAARQAELAAYQEDSAAGALTKLLQTDKAVIALDRFEVLYNITPEISAGLYRDADLVVLGKELRVGVPRTYLLRIKEQVLARLAEFHRANPQAAGLVIEALRGDLAAELPSESFGTLLREMADARQIEVTSALVRQSGHNATANAADEKLWQTLQPVLAGQGFQPLPVKELAPVVKLKEAVVRDFLHRKAKGGDLIKVGADRFYLRPAMATLAAIAETTAKAQANGQFTAAQYRDATGIGRSLAIEILEALDRVGVTQRIGDARKLRKAYEPLLGPAGPIPKAQPAAPKPAPRPQLPRGRTYR